MATKQEVLDFLNESADTYRFLSQAIFKELNDEAIAELASADFPSDAGNEHLNEGYRLIRRYFKFSAGDRRTQLACEYARIFLAAGVYVKNYHAAIPYESVFTSEGHIMMQESRDEVVAYFLHDGFQVNPDLHEPEDHLAFELEYLSVMSERAAALLEAGERAEFAACITRQRVFVEQHALRWVPELTELARQSAQLAFYVGILLVVWGTLEQSRDLLREIEQHVSEDASMAA